MSDEPLHVARQASHLIGTASMGDDLRAAISASTTQGVPGAKASLMAESKKRKSK